MANYGGKALAHSFRTVRNNTLQTAQDIPEEQYGFRPAADCRSVAQLLTHIALSPGIQMHIHGHGIDDLKNAPFMELFQGITAEESKTRSKAEILELLRSEGEKVATFFESLSDAFLAEEVAMPPGADPPTKSRLEMLLSPKEHEMHHRGQLMVIQRLLGITPHLTRQRMERFAQARQAGS